MLAYTLSYMLPYFSGNFAPFSTVANFNTLPVVLMNVVRYIYSQMSTVLSIFQSVSTRAHIINFFFFKYHLYFFLKNLIITRSNALKLIQICTNLAENV